METALKTDLLNQALAHRRDGRLDEAQRICRDLLACDPKCADAWYLLGVAAWDQGHGAQALDHLSRAIALNGRNPLYLNAMGIVWIEAGQCRQAEQLLSDALRHHPLDVDLWCNLGRALMLQERFEEALRCFSRTLALHPDHAVALFNMGVVFQSRGQSGAALEYYQRAVRIDPRHPRWWANLGTAQLSQAAYAPAAAAFRRALTLAPDHLPALKGLSVACCALGQYDEAGILLRQVLAASSGDPEATANLAFVYQHIAQWQALGDILPLLAQQTRDALDRNSLPAEQPLFNIRRAADPALNLAVARAWSRSIAQRARHAAPVFTHGSYPTDGRITIGYLSADFRSHAVAHQAVALFELHDRHNFRVCGFAVGPHQDDAYRRRITRACDRFVDLSAADSGQAARSIHESGVDILVDLMGHTHQNRLDICALRPAPLQISYLGFLASSGADYIDYLIGDAVVTPSAEAAFYSEKLIRLPGCYQIISPTPPSAPAWTRDQAKLPDEAFVFCCFNQAYKIDAEIFACWMEILRSVPSAVLWLYRSNPQAVANLRAEAARRGIHPRRLIFADQVPLADHMNRLRLADLALDTPLYNGGATTANALSAGVPLIATLGTHFVSRMSASHLQALGLASLVAKDLNHYAQLAISLARSPGQLQSLRQALEAAAAASPLFDAPRFVRNLEGAYAKVWTRHRQGRPPEHVQIDEAPAAITGPEPIMLESKASLRKGE